MSDFDRNLATARTGYRTDQVAIDAGLRAYMIRVYNYMAAGVALTGLVAWFTFQAAGGTRSFGGADLRLTSFGHAIFQSPLMWVFVLAPLGLVLLLSFGINRLSAGTALMLFFVYAGLLGLSLASIFLVYTGASITQVFFISAATFGAMSLYGYTTQRDLTGDRLVHVHGPDRHHHRHARQHVPAIERPRLGDLGDRRARCSSG